MSTATALRYAPLPGTRDDAVEADGTPRPGYAALLEWLGGADLDALARAVRAEALARDVPLPVDPVPLVIGAAEWARVAAGLEQRVRALAAFAADAHGEQRAVAAGVVPRELLGTSRYHEPDLAGTPGAPRALALAGPDLVRDDAGDLVVLEDNLRTPSMKAFAVIAAAAVDARVPAVRRHADLAGPLLAGLRAAVAAPCAVVLADGDTQDEAAWLARALGLPKVGGRDLGHAGDRLVLRDGRRPVDLVLRHTPEERLRTDAGQPTWLADALLRPLRAGTVEVVAPFGAGVADDKGAYAYADDLVRFFCGEEPLLPSVPTLDLGRPGALAEALDRAGELIFKPRSGSGGRGILIRPGREALREVRRAPAEWVAQVPVSLSTHPTVARGRLEPRRFDLRVFVAGGRALPGGLARYAASPAHLLVNAAQGGGGKAARVLAGS